jgi:glycosyltransferase involved in cell wall biosynthesis
LIDQGHDVTLFTNYPKWAVKRWGIPPSQVRTNLAHGVASRIFWRLSRSETIDRWLHEIFGRWIARRLRQEHFDVFHCFSGIALEAFEQLAPSTTLRMLVRGSAHIREQTRLLDEEEKRLGHAIGKPGSWIIEREEEEYQVADVVVVLSTFARDSFVKWGVTVDKLEILGLGVSPSSFRLSDSFVEMRRDRLLANQRLRVLYVGALSAQKGVRDLLAVVRNLRDRFDFRLVGPVVPEIKQLASNFKEAEIVGKVPEAQLKDHYAWADIFLFPTIQDGFAQVLIQAYAAGLPIVTTTNCSGPDLIREGQTGWIVPIRNPGAIIARLEWCDSHRSGLATMVDSMHHQFPPRDWEHVASDFVGIAERRLDAKLSDPRGGL